jgi:predicted flap endonuclease-1-like 5' DNA nuclease
MFGLDPLSRPVAIIEMLLLLSFAAFIGWLIARLILNSRLNSLRNDIAERERELNDCRRSKVAVAAPAPMPAPPVVLAPPMPAVDLTPAPVVAVVPEVAPPAPVVPPVTIVPPILDLNEPLVQPVAQGSEAAVLSRIASRAAELNFDRIGRATAAEADDLKDIVGVGPFLERKLHSLGIYTFRQVSNFTKEDIDKVNEIIEFFPGRIERDNWVGQSKVFYEKKNGSSV